LNNVKVVKIFQKCT